MSKSKNNFNSVIELVLVIIGSLIGAGFASGQEIFIFFYKSGKLGFLGIVLSISIICYVIFKVLKLVAEKNIDDYQKFLISISKNESSKIIKIMNIIINILLLISFFVMIAGFGAYFEQEYNLNSSIGSGILAIICFLVLINNIDGVIKISKYIVPILIFIILFVGIITITNFEVNKINIKSNFPTGVVNPILYASYNLIMVIPVLITLKNKTEKKEAKIAIFTGVVLFLLAMSIMLLLVNTNLDISNAEMPAVYIVSKQFTGLKNIYGIIILGAIFTTAISLGISFLNNTTKAKNYPQIASIMCITSVLFSKIGFSNLIKFLYPIFGIVGLLQIFLILKTKVKF